jgi:hypothetical protein
LIEARAAKAQAIEAQDLSNLHYNKNNDVMQVKRRTQMAPTGTSVAAAMRRLRKGPRHSSLEPTL